jgi:hypothetical protein
LHDLSPKIRVRIVSEEHSTFSELDFF